MILRASAIRHVQRMVADDDGATILEYAFIVSLVSIAIGILIPEIRASVDQLFLQTAAGIGAAASGGQAP